MRTRSAHHRRNSSGGDVLEGKLLGDYASDYDEHEDDERDDDDKFAKAGGGGWRGDRGSIALLLLLYTLQGVPMGLSASVSFILQEKGASYADQGIFSLASWPFSLKILWAPIVDAVYVRSIGQRRTWLIPLQLLVGATLLGLSAHLGALISDEGSDVRALSGIFFWIYVLLASQDIAVDGWALTMLSRGNVGLASTCNSVGQTVGFFLSFTGFLVLNANGSVGLGGFITFWGFVFLASAVFVLLKRERPSGQSGRSSGRGGKGDSAAASNVLTVAGAYKQALQIARLPAVLKLSAILLTRAVAFSAAETLTTLKLLERGVPKQHMATLSALMTPVSVFLPVYVSRWTGGARPLDAVTATWMYRAICALGASLVVYYVPEGLGEVGAPTPWGYYLCLYGWLAAYAALNTTHFVSWMAFYSRVSDETMGGTYMTLLNTVSNLGFKWCETAAMFLVDAFSSAACEGGEWGGREGAEACGESGKSRHHSPCVRGGGTCVSSDAPFHVAVAVSPVLAYAWLRVAGRHVDRLQKGGISKWKVRKSAGR
jgi:PAT family acetyl-CoA transporter-like MFS transporter 1